MTEKPFLTFQKFTSKDEALILKNDLEKGGIQTILENTSASVDITFTGNSFGDEFLLKVREDEFKKANEILEKQAIEAIEKFSEDHYLFQFDNDELFEVLEKPDEWSKEDFILARRILKDRGQNITDDKVEELREIRWKKIRNPEKGKIGWIVIGYLAALFGGLLGLLIGWTHWRSTKLDPTGKRFYVYNQTTRNSGRNIFLVSAFFTVFYVTIALIKT